jgi:hypothetical protein
MRLNTISLIKLTPLFLHSFSIPLTEGFLFIQSTLNSVQKHLISFEIMYIDFIR